MSCRRRGNRRSCRSCRSSVEFAGLPDGVVYGTGFPASVSGMAALDVALGLEKSNSGLGSNLWDLVSWLQDVAL